VAVAMEVTYLNFLRAFRFRTTTCDTTDISSNNRHKAGQILRWHCCHQMVKAMQQIRFRLGFRPRPRWGSLQRSSGPQLDL